MNIKNLGYNKLLFEVDSIPSPASGTSAAYINLVPTSENKDFRKMICDFSISGAEIVITDGAKVLTGSLASIKTAADGVKYGKHSGYIGEDSGNTAKLTPAVFYPSTHVVSGVEYNVFRVQQPAAS